MSDYVNISASANVGSTSNPKLLFSTHAVKGKSQVQDLNLEFSEKFNQKCKSRSFYLIVPTTSPEHAIELSSEIQVFLDKIAVDDEEYNHLPELLSMILARNKKDIGKIIPKFLCSVSTNLANVNLRLKLTEYGSGEDDEVEINEVVEENQNFHLELCMEKRIDEIENSENPFIEIFTSFQFKFVMFWLREFSLNVLDLLRLFDNDIAGSLIEFVSKTETLDASLFFKSLSELPENVKMAFVGKSRFIRSLIQAIRPRGRELLRKFSKNITGEFYLYGEYQQFAVRVQVSAPGISAVIQS